MPDRAVHWLLVFSALAAVGFFCVGLTSYFERRRDRPLWVRGIHDAGMLLSLVHLVAVVVLEPRSDGFAVAGIIMYTASVALFLSAIEAASRTRLQRAFIDRLQQGIGDAAHSIDRLCRHPQRLIDRGQGARQLRLCGQRHGQDKGGEDGA